MPPINKTRKLSLACPVCRSPEVFYSCEPKCCFNHVCAACHSTFEPATRAIGRVQNRIEPPDPLPEPADPAVACAQCESIRVYMLEDGRLVCADCGSLLELEITEVAEA
jgi:protein-arginine kinase activator protein McsA